MRPRQENDLPKVTRSISDRVLGRLWGLCPECWNERLPASGLRLVCALGSLSLALTQTASPKKDIFFLFTFYLSLFPWFSLSPAPPSFSSHTSIPSFVYLSFFPCPDFHFPSCSPQDAWLDFLSQPAPLPLADFLKTNNPSQVLL